MPVARIRKKSRKLFYAENIGPELGDGGDKWWATVACGPYVVSPPYNDSHILRIDTRARILNNEDPIIHRVGPDLGAGQKKWWLAIRVGVHGDVFCPPWCANRVLRISADGETFGLIGPDFGDMPEKWAAAVIGCDANIYCPPWCDAHTLRIDTSTQEVQRIGPPFGDEPEKWRVGVTGADGAIYCPPFNASRVLRIDVENGTVEEIGPHLGALHGKWGTAVLGEDMSIYCAPWHHSRVLRITPHGPEKDLATFVGPDLGTTPCKYERAHFGADGLVYCPPSCAEHVLCIDTGTRETILLGPQFVVGGHKWGDAAVGVDGKLYCLPYNANYMLAIGPSHGIGAMPAAVFEPPSPTPSIRRSSSATGPEKAGSEDTPQIQVLGMPRKTGVKTDLGLGDFGGGWFNQLVLGDDCNLFGIPWHTVDVLRIDTFSGNYDKLIYTRLFEGDRHATGAVGLCGTIWCPPMTAKQVLHIQTMSPGEKVKKKKKEPNLIPQDAASNLGAEEAAVVGGQS